MENTEINNYNSTMINSLIRKVTSAELSVEDSQSAYNEWAVSYEKNVMTVGRVAHLLTADNVAKCYQPKDRNTVKLLDVGAGTGLVGQELKLRGFDHIDALEPNEAMLNEARNRNVYERYIVDYITEQPSDIPQDSYDIITGCGIFSTAHVPVGALHEMIRIVKQGGYIFLTERISAFAETDGEYNPLDLLMDRLESEGKWKKISRDLLPFYTDVPTVGIFWKYQIVKENKGNESNP